MSASQGLRLIFTVTTDLNYDQRMQRICSSLAEAGFDVWLLGRVKPGSQILESRPYKQIRLRCLFSKGKWFYFEFNLRLFLFLLLNKCQLICGVDLDTALAAKWAAGIKGVPFVYDAHEYFTEIPELVDRPGIKRIWKGIEKKVVKPGLKAYTVSQSLADVFFEVYRVRFEVIRNTSVKSDSPSQLEKENYIIYAGAVNLGRGLEELIDVMPELETRLLICGEGDLLPQLRSKVNSLHLEQKVQFLGFVRPEELRRLTEKAKVGYLMLSFQGLSYYHSLANKFFDYMHAGTPQLTINFPEYALINREYEVGLLCPLDRQQILQKLKRLLEDQALYEQLRSNALKAADEYNWQNESRKLIHFYQELTRN